MGDIVIDIILSLFIGVIGTVVLGFGVAMVYQLYINLGILGLLVVPTFITCSIASFWAVHQDEVTI